MLLATFLSQKDLGISSTTFKQCALKSTDFAKITQNNGHRSRSYEITDLVLILLVINTNLLPPILRRFRDRAFDKSKIAIFCYPSWV